MPFAIARCERQLLTRSEDAAAQTQTRSEEVKLVPLRNLGERFLQCGFEHIANGSV